MSTVVWQQNQRRPQPPMPELCAYMRELFDDHKDLNVAEMIAELDLYDFEVVELQWIRQNKKEEIRAWAIAELAKLDDID